MSVGDNFRSGNVIQGAPEGLVSQTVTLTADGQYVDPNVLGAAMINLESDSTTASQRTFTLASGSMDGQGLLLIFTSAASTTAELADSGNVSLSSAWTPVVNDSLGLTWNARLGKWIETSRYVATGSDVSGPGSSTDNAVARWDGTTGAALQNSLVTIGDTGNVAGIVNLTATGTTTLATALTGVAHLASGVVSASAVVLTSEVSGVLPVANGGTNASAALTNNKVMKSVSGTIVESGITIDASNNVGAVGNLAVTGTLGVTGTTTLAAALSGIAFLTSGVVSAVSALASLTSVAVGGALTNASVGLEVNSTTKAILNARMTSTERDALTAVNGMQVYNSTTDKLQVYAAGSWVDLH